MHYLLYIIQYFHFPAEILPAEYGGSTSLEMMASLWAEVVAQHRDMLLGEDTTLIGGWRMIKLHHQCFFIFRAGPDDRAGDRGGEEDQREEKLLVEHFQQLRCPGIRRVSLIEHQDIYLSIEYSQTSNI